MLDDHVGCQLEHRSGLPTWDAEDNFKDTEAFGSAAAFDHHGGLLTHPKKAIRRSPEITAWGAEMEVYTGFFAPPRHKLAVLCLLSAQFA